MDLILWRHAEAIELVPHKDNTATLATLDSQRDLTARGQRQAARMAAWLDKQLPETSSIWVSPSNRTQQTAKVLNRKFKISPDIAQDVHPAQSVDLLLKMVQWPHGRGTHLVVGHQPTLGMVLAHILEMHAEQCTIKKGSLWWLRQRERNGISSTVVFTVQSPEML